MGNWKSESNINYFIENSYEPLAKDFLEKGYDFYIDGYTPKPTFTISYLTKDGLNYVLNDISLQCQNFEFENYTEMVDILENKGKDNYIFLFAIMPFQIRFATVSSEYNILGCDRRLRIREQKLNILLNE